MKLTRAQFFNRTTEILFTEKCQKECSYREAIEKARNEYKLSRMQLRELCSKGTDYIEV